MYEVDLFNTTLITLIIQHLVISTIIRVSTSSIATSRQSHDVYRLSKGGYHSRLGGDTRLLLEEVKSPP